MIEKMGKRSVGRPKAEVKKLTKGRHIRIPDDLYEIMRRKAAERGLDFSEWARAALCRAAGIK